MANTQFIVDNLIAGKPYAAGQRFLVQDPGKLTSQVAEVAAATLDEVELSVESAQAAQKIWVTTPVATRADLLNQAAGLLEAMVDGLADTLSREQGMLLRETRRDVNNGGKALREAAAIGPAFMRSNTYTDEDTELLIAQRPRGVVAAIVPWNAPMGLTMGKVGPALITGNTIVVKPSPCAPVAITHALYAIAGIFPEGVINVLNGDEAGPHLVNHPNVNKVSFTGSIETGVAVSQTASQTLKHLTLELGGNDPAIILADADFDTSVRGIFGQAMARSGQVCYAIKRVYVPRQHYAKYVDAFVAAAAERRVGYGRSPEATLAPVNNAQQFEFVNQLAKDAKKSGAQVHEVGEKLNPDTWQAGHYLLPRIVSDIALDHRLVTGEQFGPILPIVPYDSEAEAIAQCNAARYGLAASVWSQDETRALALVQQIQSGVGFVNSHSRTKLGDRLMPFGGSKMSGLGRTRTEFGLAEYVEPHAISLKRTPQPKDARQPTR